MLAISLVLLGTVQTGLSVPSEEVLTELPEAATLDYSAFPQGSLPPLRAEFVANVLGVPLRSVETNPVDTERPLIPSSLAERTIVEHELTNDDFDEAVTVSSVPFTAKTNTAGASREKAEPGGCAPTGGTVWYRYRAKRALGIVANTIGTTRAISLGVFEGTSLANLRRVACDTDTSGAAYIAYPAAASSTYYFQVTNTIGGGGSLVFNLDPLGSTAHASVSSGGDDGAQDSDFPSVSGDGRFVAFESDSPNLVPGDGNGTTDIFVRDLVTEKTTLESVNSSGEQSNAASLFPSLSADGRYLSFGSCATNLVPNDTNGVGDAFVRDRLTGKTTRVSVNSNGEQGVGDFPTLIETLSTVLPCLAGGLVPITPDGRYVAFDALHPDLVEGDTNAAFDVFVHDRVSGETERVSVSSSGEQADCDSGSSSISNDGRYVAFASCASTLVPNDANTNPATPSRSAWDVFVHDRVTGRTERVSVDSSGEEGNDDSWRAFISADGRFVSFPSVASNLVANDGNGVRDSFVHDRLTHTTTRVSVTSTGAEQVAPQDDTEPVVGPFVLDAAVVLLSADGRYATFDSRATNLVPDDTNGMNDVFVHDRRTGTTVRVSVSSTGQQGNNSSRIPALSADGGVVVFQSLATNLGGRDTDAAAWDVFAHQFSRPRSDAR